MKKRERGTSISAAMDDLKKFSKSLIEEFKIEGEKLLAEKMKELKESAAGDYTKKPSNKAECMQTTGQAQMQKSPQSGENKEIEDAELEGLSTLDGPRKSRRTVKKPAWMKDFITMGKSEEKIEGTESEDRSTLDRPRKSRRTTKEPAWMKDFKTD
ncbi:uncharacterized protein LOC141666446 [Apium graveolens]|uniref:uncharacterized protein LOC141666446 n=1 Tax=Apium graveolens TaxID=4045 RepID=UPI003D7AD4D0